MRIETLYLEVTRMCTLECEHCVRGDRENKFMSSETINNALKDVKEIGLLFFEGGEPLLAIDQILETIEIIKTRGIKVDRIRIISNGTVLNESVIDALTRLSNFATLSLSISMDAFHATELARLNLLETWRKNNKVFQEMFESDVLQWSSEDGCIQIGDDYFIPIVEAGRAKTITKQRLKYFNSLLKDHFIFVIFDARILYREKVMLEYKPETNEVSDGVYIDVNGNVIPWCMSFAEADEDASKYSFNINKIGLLNAIFNYIDHYTEYFDSIDESQFEELNTVIGQRISDPETRKS